MEKGKNTKHTGVFRLSNRRWRVVVQTKKGGVRRKRERLVEGTEREALAARLVLLDELDEEIARAPRPTRRNTVAGYAERWIIRKRPRLKSSTLDHYISVLAERVLPILGEHDCTAVRRSDVVDWCVWAEAQRREDGLVYSSSSLNAWWRVLRQMVKDMAADVGILDPTLRIRPPTSNRQNVRERRTLTVHQVGIILDVIGERWPGMHAECSVLAFTGIRDGELRGLNCGDYRKVGDVQVLVIERAVLHDGSVGATKTGEPRIVPVTPALAILLDQHLASLRAKAYLAVGDMPLFPGRLAARRSHGAHHACLVRAGNAVGIGWSVGPQTLRRTLNSRLREAAPGELVRAVLGHATEEMTHHYYGADLAAARDVVALVMSTKGHTTRDTPKETAGAVTPAVNSKT